MEIPEHIQVIRQDQRTKIIRPFCVAADQRSLFRGAIFLFTVLFLLITTVLLPQMMQEGQWVIRGLWAMIAIGYGMFMYRSVAHMVNKTFIVIDSNTLEIWHGPLPWPGTVYLLHTTIQHIEAFRKYPHLKRPKNSPWYLVALLQDGRRIHLLDLFREEGEVTAKFLEEEIRRAIGGKIV